MVHNNGNSFTDKDEQIPLETNRCILSSKEDYSLHSIHHDTAVYNPV